MLEVPGLGAALGPPQPAHLKHLLDVGVLGLQQLAPGGEVAVGEDPAGLQQAEGMVLRRSGGERCRAQPPRTPPRGCARRGTLMKAN